MTAIIDAGISKEAEIEARSRCRAATDWLDRQCTLVSWNQAVRDPHRVVGRPSPCLTDDQQAAVVAEYARAMGVEVTSWPFRRGSVSVTATGQVNGVTVQVVAEPLCDPNAPAVPHAVESPAEDADVATDESGAHAGGAEVGDAHDEGPAGGAR